MFQFVYQIWVNEEKYILKKCSYSIPFDFCVKVYLIYALLLFLIYQVWISAINLYMFLQKPLFFPNLSHFHFRTKLEKFQSQA